MIMRYITIEDIATLIHNQLVMQSVENDKTLMDSIEDLVISEVCAYLTGRYDTDRIFADPPVRTGLLVRVISCITVCRAVRRNAARKVPDTFYEYEDWAIDMLERLRDGKMQLPPDVPVVKNEDGSDASPMIYGHSRNGGWFL